MSFRPLNKKIIIGDTWHCFDNEKIHAFFLQFQKNGEADSGKENGAIGHAVSEDMLHWDVLPTAVMRGENGKYDDLEHWTGCTVFNNNKFYLYYTSRSSVAPDFSNSLAVSANGITFKKYEKNPLFTPDQKYYYGETNRPQIRFHGNYYPGKPLYDYRDFAVAFDEKTKEWIGYFAARVPDISCADSAVIGMAHSPDLVNWMQDAPCFKPQKYHVIETPDVFKMNGKWYLLCLSGNVYGQRHCSNDTVQYDRLTFYAVADNPRGPFYEPENNLLIANMNASGACAKTVLVGDKRYIFYTEVLENGDNGSDNFMSVPKEVTADENGRLYLKWYEKIENYYKGEHRLTGNNQIENDGKWGTTGDWSVNETEITGSCKNDWSCKVFDITAENFVFEAEIKHNGSKSTAFLFDLGDSVFAGGTAVIFDYSLNQILITDFRRFNVIDARSFEFEKEQYKIKVYVNKAVIEIYVDGVFILHHLKKRNKGKLGLMTECGTAVFKNCRVNELKEF